MTSQFISNDDRPITLVLGATGKTGRRVTERLTARGFPVRAGSRAGRPPFDWEDEATWAPAVQGADAVYVTYYPDLSSPAAAERVSSFAGVAVQNGVRRLVLLSGRNEAGALRAERRVMESGAQWTIVRSSFMNQNFDEGFWRDAVLAGELYAPAGDITEPFIDAGDIADVVVAPLTEDGHHGEVYEVTGPRLLTFTEAVNEIGSATGREVRYVPVSFEEFRMGMIAEGVPDDFASALTDLFAEVLDGRGSCLADGVQRALGREPKDFSDYALEAEASGVWDTQPAANAR